MVDSLSIDTFGDLIRLALKSGGVVGVGQTPMAEDVNDCAKLLNIMLAQWRRRRYLVYHLVEQSTQATGAQSYSVGPGGDFSMSSRPAAINYAFARQTINANPNQIDYPLALLPARETYAQVAMKQLQAFPQWAWYDAAFPLAQMFVYPVITSQFSIFIGYAEILQSVTSLTDTINLPPEYAEAMLYNLAARISANYSTPLNPAVPALAKAALETMRTVNAQVPQMSMPRVLRGGAHYNIFSDRAGPGNY